MKVDIDMLEVHALQMRDAHLKHDMSVSVSARDALALIARIRESESVALTAREAELCSQAIGVWTSDYSDTPEELTALRVKLLTIQSKRDTK